jgi:cob(I)alamin adenosyltransferase
MKVMKWYTFLLPYLHTSVPHMSIVTRTGDKGETGLFGGERVSKADMRIHAYGTVDELNALLGVIVAAGHVSENLKAQLLRTQNMLFRLGADLATPRENNNAKVPRIEQEHIQELDEWITQMEEAIPPLQFFILPGGSHGSALLHVARTVCRRAERWTVALQDREEVGTDAVMYLNRLSDYLFLAAMKANEEAGVPDVQVKYD